MRTEGLTWRDGTQDIDALLAQRSEKLQLGNSKGKTFSTTTFSMDAPAQVPSPARTCSHVTHACAPVAWSQHPVLQALSRGR